MYHIRTRRRRVASLLDSPPRRYLHRCISTMRERCMHVLHRSTVLHRPLQQLQVSFLLCVLARPIYAVLGGGSNGDGAWRGLVTIVQLIDPRPYMFQPAMYGRLTYTVIYMSDRLLTQANPYTRLPPPPDLRSFLSLITQSRAA